MRTPVEQEARNGKLHLTEVDGVPAVWCDVPGPLRAGLVTRMGSADDPAHQGISHLLSICALRLGRTAAHPRLRRPDTHHLQTSGEQRSRHLPRSVTGRWAIRPGSAWRPSAG
jgi:hypothetical protein